MSDTTTSLALKGTVVAVASNATHEFTKPTKETIRLIEDHGVEGDAHAGRFIQHRFLAKKMPVLPNNRQVHLMPSELFSELASSGFHVAPGNLGENVTTAGLDLTKSSARHTPANRKFGNCRTHGPSDTVRADRSLSEGIETSHDHEARTANVQVWRARCCKGDRANRARRSHNC